MIPDDYRGYVQGTTNISLLKQELELARLIKKTERVEIVEKRLQELRSSGEKYHLEKMRMYEMGDSMEIDTLDKSDDLDALIEKAKKVKLTGNQYYWEETRIIELENGEIIDYVWESEGS